MKLKFRSSNRNLVSFCIQSHILNMKSRPDFLENLSDVIRVPLGNMLLVLGDFNATLDSGFVSSRTT
jgi:hypothetical protein